MWYIVIPVTLVDETRRLAKRVDEYRRAIQKVAVKVSTLAKHTWKSNHRVDWGQAASWTTVCARLYEELALEAYHIRRETLASIEQGQGHVACSLRLTDKIHIALTGYIAFLWIWLPYHHLSLGTLSAFLSLGTLSAFLSPQPSFFFVLFIPSFLVTVSLMYMYTVYMGWPTSWKFCFPLSGEWGGGRVGEGLGLARCPLLGSRA